MALASEVVAQALIDAITLGDPAAAEKHGVSVRSLQRYRARLSEDPDGELAQSVAAKRKALTAEWLAETARARMKILAKLERMVEAAPPEMIREVAGALKIVHDASVSERVVADGLGSEGAGAAAAAETPSPFAAGARAIGNKLGH